MVMLYSSYECKKSHVMLGLFVPNGQKERMDGIQLKHYDMVNMYCGKEANPQSLKNSSSSDNLKDSKGSISWGLHFLSGHKPGVCARGKI